jgi:hypothetical protein
MQQAEQTGKMMKCLADFKLAKDDIRPSIGFVRPSEN